MGADPRTALISDSIRIIPNFPKVRRKVTMVPVMHCTSQTQQQSDLPLRVQAGIMFQDVTTILLDPVAFKHTVDMLHERYQGTKIDVVAGGACGRHC